MNSAGLFRDFLSLVSSHPLLERLFFASLEFAALAGLVWVAIRSARIKSARLTALLWLVVLTKPIVSLAVGSPLHVLRVEIDKTEEIQDLPPSDPPAPIADTAPPPLSKEGPGGVAQSNLDVPFPGGPHDNLFPRSLPPTDFASASIAEPLAAAPLPAVEPEPETASASDSARWNAAKFLIPLWLTGVAYFAFRSGLDRFQLRRLLRRTDTPDGVLSAHYLALVARLRIGRPPRLRVTDEIESPALIGSLLPTILMPRWLAGSGDQEKIDWALRHELMHWKLLDPPAGLIREVAQGLFYFHPAAWWAGRHWEFAAELACDRAIITDADDSHAYATQLFGMLEEIRGRRQIAVRTGLFATRTQIAQRIAALLRGPLTTRAHLSALAIVAVLAISAVALSVGGTFAEKKEVPEGAASEAETTSADDSPGTVAPILDSKAGEEKNEAQSQTKNEAIAPKDAAAEVDNDVEFTFAGTVVSPDGKPVPGAKLYLDYFRRKLPATEAAPVGVSDGQGRFQFNRRRSQFHESGEEEMWPAGCLIATKDGYGFASGQIMSFETSGRLERQLTENQRQWIDWLRKPEINRTNVLTLVFDDVPVRGRVLTTEGQPVAGARVEASHVYGGADGKLDAWEAATKEPTADYNSVIGKVLCIGNGHFLSGVAAVPATQTDADGWFTLKGLGRERIVELFVTAPKIATTSFHARSRPGETVRIPQEKESKGLGFQLFYPQAFTSIAGSTAPAEGRVIDSRTNQPLAGFPVHAVKLATGGSHGTLAALYLQTVTDADGRYRLEGLPIGNNTFQVIPPYGTPYLPSGVNVTIGTSVEPVPRDVALKRGVIVQGRVTDRQTGKPIVGHVEYFAFLTNPHLQEADSFKNSSLRSEHYRTDADGRYEIPALPGKGILTFRASESAKYPSGTGADQVEGRRKESNFIAFDTAPHNCHAHNYHVVTQIEPDCGVNPWGSCRVCSKRSARAAVAMSTCRCSMWRCTSSVMRPRGT